MRLKTLTVKVIEGSCRGLFQGRPIFLKPHSG